MRIALIMDSLSNILSLPFSTSEIRAERFTSSFPVQIKLHMIELASLTSSSGIGITDALNKRFGIAKVLTI